MAEPKRRPERSPESFDCERLYSSIIVLPVSSRLVRYVIRTLPGFYPGAPKRNVIVTLAYLLVGVVVLSILWNGMMH